MPVRGCVMPQRAVLSPMHHAVDVVEERVNVVRWRRPANDQEKNEGDGQQNHEGYIERGPSPTGCGEHLPSGVSLSAEAKDEPRDQRYGKPHPCHLRPPEGAGRGPTAQNPSAKQAPQNVLAMTKVASQPPRSIVRRTAGRGRPGRSR